MKYFRKTIDSKVSQWAIISLNNIFGDSSEQIAEKTGLSKELIDSAIRGEDCLTAKHIRKIADSYEVPYSFILLKIAEQIGNTSEEMKKSYEPVRNGFLASAKAEEEANKEYGKSYINWRALV
jgi:transcriptional regulator with XRE-family HTH domain